MNCTVFFFKKKGKLTSWAFVLYESLLKNLKSEKHIVDLEGRVSETAP